MTTRHVIELEAIYLFAIAAAVGVAMAVYTNHFPRFRTPFSLPVVTEVQPSPVISPIQKIDTFSQISPDGTKMLTMSVKVNSDSTKTYSVTTTGPNQENPQFVYGTKLSGSETITIPFNTWSPDDKYVFLNRNSDSDSGALVMRADGQPIVPDQQYLNATSFFNARQTGNIYQDTTGWASETLLIINTVKEDNSKSTSYWFEVPSKAIIPLATEF